MRSFIVLAMFTATLAHAGWNEYEEVRNLSLESGGLQELSINAGAGSMEVTGVAGADAITVKATIIVPKADDEKAMRVIEKSMRLSLQRDGDKAELKSFFESGFLGRNSDAYIVLEVSVPQGLSVKIDDGAGSLDVIDTLGDVAIDDGSGSIEVRNVANLNIDDGSGSIDVSGATGDVYIEDGSGSIKIRNVAGSVRIDDGSGGIRVSDVEHDLIIIDDGSGGLSISDVRGSVDADT